VLWQLTPPHASQTAIDNEWIVVFKETATVAQQATHKSQLKSRIHGDAKSTVMHEYDNLKAHGFAGYAVHLENATVLESFVRSEESVVSYVEPNQVVKSNCVEQREATWGLSRTSKRALAIDGIYTYDEKEGAGVDVYVIDTGIYVEHDEFEGRAVWGVDMVDTPSDETDRNGHGTHVAGTVMSRSFGIAKAATAIAVKVLGASGSGSTAGVIGGVDWVASHHAGKGKPSVANMSLGGGLSTASNSAVNAVVAAGVSMAVASGNDNRDACNYSPASATSAFTVNSFDTTDTRSVFSNFGTCSNIFAPGTGITSTWIGSEYSINTISGTSMASPHVAGVMAMLYNKHPTYTPSQIYQLLEQDATDNLIVNEGAGSPNVLLFNDCS